MEPGVPLDTHGWLVQNARALRSLAHKLVRSYQPLILVANNATCFVGAA